MTIAWTGRGDLEAFARLVPERLPRPLGREEDRQPAVRDLEREPDVLRAERRKVVGISARSGRAISFSGLPSPVAPGQHVRDVVVLDRGARSTSRRSAATHDLDVLARLRASGFLHGSPCQPSTTCGPDVPSPSTNRPPSVSWSSVIAVIAQFAGVRPGICMIADPILIRVVFAASHDSTVTASRPPGLGRPRRVVAEPLRLDGQLDQVERRGAGRRVAHVEAELHAAQDTQSETSVAALGNKVVVAFNDSGSFLGGLSHFTGYASSSNTGGSFIDHGILPASAVGDAGDPMLARDNATGAFYLTTLGFNRHDVVQFFKSTDGGQTFGPPISIPAGALELGLPPQQQEWLTVDNFAGAGQHDIYSCDTNFGGVERIEFFRSIDQGVTFGPPPHRRLRPRAATVATTSSSAPTTASTSSTTAVHGGGGQEGDNKLFVRRSVDLGFTFGPEHQVADLNTSSANGDLALKGGFRSTPFPQAAVNPISGDLVVTYNDDPNLGSPPDNGDVFYVESTDDGVTWSSPVRINEVAANDQFSPTAAITPNGQSIMFGWYDRSEDANNLWFHRRGRAGTMNTTSGVDHAPAQLPAQPEHAGRDRPRPGRSTATYMGDYDQIDATNAFFHTTWADNRDPSAAHSHQPDVRYAQIVAVPANWPSPSTSPRSPATIDVQVKATTLTVSRVGLQRRGPGTSSC